MYQLILHASVERSCKRGRRIIRYTAKNGKEDKQSANRAYRRTLNEKTRTFRRDPESFYDETFDVKFLTVRDIC